jgi:DNA-directed RNA polymerase subunit N (RpoN/RPB10)
MIIPVRCVTCGKVLADKYKTYLEKVNEFKENEEGDSILGVNYIERGEKIITPEAKALQFLGLTRYCCRRHLLTHVDLISEI